MTVTAVVERTCVIKCHGDDLTIIAPGKVVHVQSRTALGRQTLRETLAGADAGLIFLDLSLPSSHGVELLRVINQTCHNVAVITRIQPRQCEPRLFVIDLVNDGIVLRPLTGLDRGTLAELHQHFAA